MVTFPQYANRSNIQTVSIQTRHYPDKCPISYRDSKSCYLEGKGHYSDSKSLSGCFTVMCTPIHSLDGPLANN